MLHTYGLERKFKVPFDVILVENSDTEIYTSSSLDKTEETIEKRLYQIYKIIDSIYIEGKYYYLVKKGKHIIGWINLVNSIVLFNKEEKPVKIKNDNFERAYINTIINIELGLLDTSKVYTSKYYIKNENDEFLEVLMERNKVRAIIKTEDLEHAVLYNKKIKIDETIDLYKDSGLNNKINIENMSNEATLVDYFEDIKIARINVNKKRVWIKFDSLNLEYLPTNPKLELNEQIVIIDHVVSLLKKDENNAKLVIKRLLKENRELIKTINDFNNSQGVIDSEKLKRIESRYESLKNSKLGKLQLSYWKFRNKRRD